jgi:tripartite-type tricarboxylate transporter receptor subunit TctC
MTDRRRALQGLCATLLLGGGGQGLATTYPSRPVRLIVGFAPGGANDISARLFAEQFQRALKQPFVVENRAGANSIIAAEQAARAANDGYTLFAAGLGALTVNPALHAKLPYDPVNDFELIGEMGYFPFLLVARSDLAAADVPSLVALGRKADGLTHGVGSEAFRLAGEFLSRQSGIKLLHVNYKGTGPVVNALLSREIDLAIVDTASALSLVQAGSLRALAVTTARRSSVLPGVPTMAEWGVADYDVSGWTGLAAPAGTPAAVLEVLRTTLRSTLAEASTIDRMRGFGMEPGRFVGPAMHRRVAEERQRWMQVARQANLQAN